MTDIKSAEENLAFVRTILEEREQGLKNGGAIYAAAGILYGLQCLIAWLDLSSLLPLPEAVLSWNSILPTIFFLLFLGWALWRDRENMQQHGVASRAVTAAFASAGFANIALVIVFAFYAYQQDDFSIWLFYPVMVCALQGAVWYVMAMVQKRWWMGGIAAGWLLTTLATGLLIPSPAHYLLALCIGLFAFMALPGMILVRIGRKGS